MSEQGGGSGSGFDFLDRSRSSRRRRGKAASTQGRPIAPQTDAEPEAPTPEGSVGTEGDTSSGPVATVEKTPQEPPQEPPSTAGMIEGDRTEASLQGLDEPEHLASRQDEESGRQGRRPGTDKVGESRGAHAQASEVSTRGVGTLEAGAPVQQSATRAMRKDPAKQQISAYVDRTIKVRFDMRRMQDALESGGRQVEQAEIIEMLMDFYATHGDPNALSRREDG